MPLEHCAFVVPLCRIYNPYYADRAAGKTKNAELDLRGEWPESQMWRSITNGILRLLSMRALPSRRCLSLSSWQNFCAAALIDFDELWRLLLPSQIIYLWSLPTILTLRLEGDSIQLHSVESEQLFKPITHGAISRGLTQDSTWHHAIDMLAALTGGKSSPCGYRRAVMFCWPFWKHRLELCLAALSAKSSRSIFPFASSALKCGQIIAVETFREVR